VAVVTFDGKRPRIIVTTDVNGTTTPHNTFGELVRADGLFDEMEQLMKSYTSGSCKFSDVLPRMKHLAAVIDRNRLQEYARALPLYTGVTATFDELIQSENVDTRVALSTTAFAGLMALVNKFRHRSLLTVAASPVLGHLLSQEEQSCLIRPITDEGEKVHVLDDLADLHKPNRHLLFHVGDTMGDFLAIKHAAELGGIGIAFNPNTPLKISISSALRTVRTRICEIDFPPGEKPDYTKVGDVIREQVWKVVREQL
jgi:phosphoserine phosphatase